MPDNLEIKSFGSLAFDIKDADKGEVSACVATLGIVDKDGDVLFPEAFPDGAKVRLSRYGHDVIKKGAEPVGIGTISAKGDKAVFNGRYFMSTERGRDAFHVAKEMGPEYEWSFAFLSAQTKTASMTEEWRTKGAKRLITGLVPMEASPVFEGAGFGTGTLYAKAKEEEPSPPDPEIEAKRIALEEEAARAREINDYVDKRFKRGIR